MSFYGPPGGGHDTTNYGTFRRRTLNGELLLGAFLDLGSSTSTDIVAGTGFDWLVIDMEHGSLGRDAALTQVRAAGDRGAVLVRVPSPSSDLIGWSLDAGAVGVVVPRVETLDEVRLAEAATRFAAARGAAPSARAAGYGRADGYSAEADGHRLFVVQVETAGALAQVEQIAMLDGVDVLFLGPADLARSVGIAGTAGHPDVLAAAEQIAGAASRAGKAAGVYLHDPGLAGTYRSIGYSFIASGFDSSLLVDATSERLAALRRAVSSRRGGNQASR